MISTKVIPEALYITKKTSSIFILIQLSENTAKLEGQDHLKSLQSIRAMLIGESIQKAHTQSLTIQYGLLTILLISWRCKPIPIQIAFIQPLESKTTAFIKKSYSHGLPSYSEESLAIRIFLMRSQNLSCSVSASLVKIENPHTRPTSSLRQEDQVIPESSNVQLTETPHLNA